MAKSFDTSKMEVLKRKKFKLDAEGKELVVCEIYRYNGGDIKLKVNQVKGEVYMPFKGVDLETAAKVARLIKKTLAEYEEESA
jgi:hypothetical protein